MIGNLFSILLILLLFIPTQLVSNEASISVKSSVTKTNLTINDILEYKITISGAKNSPKIDESFLKDFSIMNRSTQQSYQLINNNFFSSQIKTFRLRPNIEGTIIIPSSKIVIEGTVYETDPITITVLAGTSSPKANSSAVQKSSNTANGQASQNIPQGSSKDLFILAVLDKDQAYVGEEIIYSVRLYRRFSTIDQLLYQEPKFDMLTEQLERDQQTYTQSYNGIRYYVQEIDRRSLFSYEPGLIEIPEASADVQINFFYGNQTLRSNTLSLTITPLPEDGKPDDFSGLVGDFGFDFDVNTMGLVENKPIAIRLSVGGSGNLKQLSNISFSTDSDIFKVYQSSVNDLITYDNSVKGVRHFEYIMVPKVDGTLSLPQFYFSYFDPKLNQYKTLETPQSSVSVIDSGDSTAPISGADTISSVTELRKDLRYIKESISFDDQAKPFYKHIFSLALILLNSILSLMIGYSFFYKSPAYDILIKPFSQTTNKRVINSLEQLKKNPSCSVNDIQQNIFIFLSYLLDRPTQGLPLSEIIEELSEKKYDSSTINDLESLLDQCSFLAYSPDSSSEASKNDICDKAIDIIKRIKS